VTRTLAALVGVMLLAPTAAFAAGGYYSGALGARAAGRSGAFVARADDPTAVSYNPSGLVNIDETTVMLGNRLSYNVYDFTRGTTVDWGHEVNGTAPTVSFPPVHNARPWQTAEPLIGVVSKLGLSDWGFALAAIAGPGTSNESYPPAGGQRYMMVSREAIILDYAASAAWRPRPSVSFGATLEWIHVPKLDYSLIIDGTPFAGAANPVSSNLDLLAQTSGSDPFTFNAIVGGWWRATPHLDLAFAAQVVPASIVAKSTLKVTPLDRTMPQVVITRHGVPADDVTITLPQPLMARIGARYRGLAGDSELFDLELDLEYEGWSRVKDFTLDTHGLTAELQGAFVDLASIRIAKQWRDTVAARIGGDYAVVPRRWFMRGGVFYETAVAPASHANVDFAGGQMLGGSLGSSLVFGRLEVAFAYQLRYQPTFTVSEAGAHVYQQVPATACMAPYTDPIGCNPHYLGQPAPAINGGSYGAMFHYLSLALLYRYGQ
jgi:long-subunit fatty acid transport protein